MNSCGQREPLPILCRSSTHPAWCHTPTAHGDGGPWQEAGDGWYDSGEDQSCDTGCAAFGLVCTEMAFFAHNDDVDTSSEVLALIESVGGSTSDSDCAATYGSNGDVPQWMSGVCHRSSASRALSTFDCTAAPNPQGEGKHRLCYCHQASPASSPPPSTALSGVRSTFSRSGFLGACWRMPNADGRPGARGGCSTRETAWGLGASGGT